MDFPLKTGKPARQGTDCAILPVFDDGVLRGATEEIDRSARGAIKQLVRVGDAASRLGATTLVPRTTGAARRWLLVGCGKHADFDARRLAAALGAAVVALRGSGAREALSYVAYGADSIGVEQAARQSVETTRAQVYRFDELKSRRDPPVRLARLGVGLPPGSDTRTA